MRTDIHSPKSFNPGDYQYVGTFDNWPEPGAFLNRAANPYSMYKTDFGPISAMTMAHAEYLAGRKLLHEQGVNVNFERTGGCDHCGVRIRYVCVHKHIPTGQYIAVGLDCATNRFTLDSRREFDVKRLRERAANERERRKSFGKANTFLEEHAPELVDWMLSPQAEDVHTIFADMARRLIRYGTLSTKQINFARVLLREHLERQQNNGKTLREIERETEKANAEDCPTGRVTLTGEIVKLDARENAYGVHHIMIVRDDRGFCVWMTRPSILSSAEKGDRVTVTATVKPSDKDPKFGFGKSPVVGQAKPPQQPMAVDAVPF